MMIAAIDQYVREKCGYSVLKDKDFEVSRKVLNGKATDLQQFGMGKRPRKSDPLTGEEEVILWQTVLGKENPTSFFFLISQHFGTRGRQEHHQIRIEHLKIINDLVTGEITAIEWAEDKAGRSEQAAKNGNTEALSYWWSKMPSSSL